LKHWKEKEHRADKALEELADLQPAQRSSREMDISRLRGKGNPKKHVRPRLKGSPAEVDVREMRRKPFENISGY